MREIIKKEKAIIGGILLVGIVLAVAALILVPKYKIYMLTQQGKADLAKAEYSRQIRTVEAKQKQESAKYEAEAEIIRAEGVAKANKIIADGLGGSEGYLRYLWIDKLGNLDNVIYIPTEAGLPILEAGKR